MSFWQRLLAIVAGLSALGAAATALPQASSQWLIVVSGLLGALSLVRLSLPISYWLDGALALLASVAVLTSLGLPGPPLWLSLLATWFFAWLFIDRVANALAKGSLRLPGIGLIVPLAFGFTLLVMWEALVQGLNVNHVLLPPPSAIWAKLIESTPTLWKDFQQTYLKGVLSGFALGTVVGLAVAILVDRSPFLKRGILPIGNFASALPIVGVAPIMVMWFGYDWQSKAAVVVCVTFFPMLINTLAGINSAGRMEGDMMRTYAASYWQSLFKLRLPAAMPFIFNALKINSTLALIAAIVAEFFGSPIVGMGFRISTGVGRLEVEMVWAEVAVAALAGSVSYGLIALIERAVTFWHPSVRGGRA